MQLLRLHLIRELEAVEPVPQLDQEQVIEILAGDDRSLDHGGLEDPLHPTVGVESRLIGRAAELAGRKVVGRGWLGGTSRQPEGGDASGGGDGSTTPEESAAAPAVAWLLIDWHERTSCTVDNDRPKSSVVWSDCSLP